jgi:hypothetical protein
MSAKRSSKQTGADNSAERTRQAAASTDAAAFVTTTGAMLLGVLAAEMEQDGANALASGRDEHNTIGASVPNDAPVYDIRHPAADAIIEQSAPVLPFDGDAAHRIQSAPESFSNNDTEHDAVPNDKVVHSAVLEQPGSEVATSSENFQPSGLDASAHESADVSPGVEQSTIEPDHSVLDLTALDTGEIDPSLGTLTGSACWISQPPLCRV